MPKDIFGGNDSFSSESIRKYLKTKKLGQEINFLAKTDSTQSIAQRLAQTGAEEGLLVVADSQSQGRGRHDHSWDSPAGVNLYFSLLFRPNDPIWPLDRVNEIQFMCSVATANCLKKHCGSEVELKWPNDIRANDKKLGGIILFTVAPNSKRVDYIIMGMGLNLNAKVSDFNVDVKHLATSIFQITQKEVNRSMFLAYLLKEIEEQYEMLCNKGFDPIRKKWQELAPKMMNSAVSLRDVITDPEETALVHLQGMAKGIDNQGRLLVEIQGGKTKSIVDGVLT